MGLELQGLDKVLNNFEKINRQVEKNLIESLKKNAEMLLDKSREIAPRDTGNMVRESDVVQRSKLDFVVSYNEDYALYVHEDLEKKHQKGGRAKFLQIATNDNGRKVIRDIKEDLLR